MRAWLKGFSGPVAFAILTAALLLGLGFAIGHSAGLSVSAELGWICAALLLAVLAVAHFRFVHARIWRNDRLTAALRGILRSDDTWRKNWAVDSLVSGIGDDVRDEIDALADEVAVVRQGRRRAELALANMADGILAVGCDGKITMLNRAAATLIDEKESRLLGERLQDAPVHPEIMRLADQCVASRSVESAEITLAGYPQRVVSIRATPYPASESSDCAILIFHDLTEIRRHERSQKEFVSNVSHELKTPLTAVRTTAEALLNGAKNDEDVVDRFLNTIISESDRLSVLIEDIMDIARMDSGIASTEKCDSDVSTAVQRAVAVLQGQASIKNIEISVVVPENLRGWFDPDQMVQVIRNLVDNAVKYTPEGGRIEIEAGAGRSGLRLRVADTGIGIPHGELDRVFERFYRVDKARSRRLGGTGLGLAIVKDIVEAHGGSVRADTQLGRGSTFIVELPSEDSTIS